MTKFRIDKSPFEFERNYHAKSVSKSFRLPEDVFNAIMIYYDGVYGEDNNLTRAFNDIAIDKLNNICRERKSFQDLNIVMIIPKTDDIIELNEKSKIIGFFTIDDINDLNRDLIIRDESDEEILIKESLEHYTLESYYNMIQYINPKCFKFDMNDVSSFDDFKIRLNKAYPKIDLDNCDILSMELNNYFDIFRDGEFQSKLLNNNHIGAYALVDEVKDTKIFLNVYWNYTSNSSLDINFSFKDYMSFMAAFDVDTQVSNDKIHFRIMDIKNGEDRKKALIENRDEIIAMRNQMEEHISKIDEILRRDYPEDSDDIHK